MLWSSFCEGGYALAMAHSKSNTIDGPWVQDPELLFDENGGHGMLFTDLSGNLTVTLHSPNIDLKERPVFFKIDRNI